MSKIDNSIAVVGLGYVGLPLLIELNKFYNVIGIDNNKFKISELKKNIDKEKILDRSNLKYLKIIPLSTSFKNIKKYKFIIVCVPTPITTNNKPDLSHIKNATTEIAKFIRRNTTVIYESTVYPGVTEEICIPIIEKISQLKWKKDFFIGFSPERVSPGMENKDLSSITKIISGDSNKTIQNLKKIYGSILEKNLHVASSIKVAEAAKVLENIQRDVNIALINEISIIFNILNINTTDVIEAASTKWNFHKYTPGLVGGHCIGVDPYYLLHKSQTEGFHPRLINVARSVNNEMPYYVTNSMKQILNQKKIKLDKAKILYLGITYKENTSDMRNSKSLIIINELIEIGIEVLIHDNMLNKTDFQKYFDLKLNSWNDINKYKYDIIILGSPHRYYLSKGLNILSKLLKKNGLIYDIKGSLKSESNNYKNNYFSI